MSICIYLILNLNNLVLWYLIRHQGLLFQIFFVCALQVSWVWASICCYCLNAAWKFHAGQSPQFLKGQLYNRNAGKSYIDENACLALILAFPTFIFVRRSIFISILVWRSNAILKQPFWTSSFIVFGCDCQVKARLLSE